MLLAPSAISSATATGQAPKTLCPNSVLQEKALQCVKPGVYPIATRRPADIASRRASMSTAPATTRRRRLCDVRLDSAGGDARSFCTDDQRDLGLLFSDLHHRRDVVLSDGIWKPSVFPVCDAVGARCVRVAEGVARSSTRYGRPAVSGSSPARSAARTGARCCSAPRQISWRPTVLLTTLVDVPHAGLP
jgi:hypothetical protein